MARYSFVVLLVVRVVGVAEGVVVVLVLGSGGALFTHVQHPDRSRVPGGITTIT